MRQVVFTDVLIVGQLDVDGQRFAPIGLHITDPTSDWLLIKRHWIGMTDLSGVQLQNESITAAIGVILAFIVKKMFDFY